MASTVFIRHTLNALYSDLNVTLQKLIVNTPSSSHSPGTVDSEAESYKPKHGKRLSREKSILIKFCVTGNARVSGSAGEWEVYVQFLSVGFQTFMMICRSNSTYTFSPRTGLIRTHTINSIYPAPHQAVYDALRMSLGKVFGLGEGARTNGAACRAGKTPEN